MPSPAPAAAEPLPQQTSAPASPPSPRLVAAVVRGQRIPVPCPSWCVVDHSAQDLAFLEDLSHAGETVTLPVRQFDGSLERILAAQLVEWPFTEKNEAYLSVDADGSGECNEYRGPAGLAFADQLVAHAERIRRLVGALG
ncbi:DUF6907 domain-containing protein [Streptomyces sparsogenes]|uniref:DUF6907 domain-containing protein n=1 Tax=Streptomyces sparsogenes TaxID=67365 RepID=UPI003F4CC90E